MTSGWTRALVSGALLATIAVAGAAHALYAGERASVPLRASANARLNGLPMASDVRVLTDWVARSIDHGGAPFIVVDKRNARLHVFDGQSSLVASTPVLLGAARGDDSVPGIGERRISDILPHERTTPAGRFVGERGRNHKGERIVWVDYDAAVSIHRVRAGDPVERRLERLASKTSADNRISYGCINVPQAFFDTHVLPLFEGRKALVYVMPETRAPEQVFPALRMHQSATPRALVRG